MKIEIELEELESIKRRLEVSELEKQKIQKEMELLGEDYLVGKALDLSYSMFKKYIKFVFKELGFNDDSEVYVDQSLRRMFIAQWYNKPEQIDLKIGATITNKFKHAVLSIGVKPDVKTAKGANGITLDSEP